MRGLSGQMLFLGAVVTAGVLVAAALLFDPLGHSAAPPSATVSKLTVDDIRQRGGFDGREAFDYLKQLSAIGPRPSGSAGMIAQQKLVTGHFKKLGGQVSFQEFRARNPQDGGGVPMANMIVQWHPDRKQRILLCTHYDTLPLPLRDKENPKGVFLGANDGASGVAVLMELAKSIPQIKSNYGIDFVLFDGEEFVFRTSTRFDPGDPMFLGAEHFARQYVVDPPTYKYRWGVLLDMVGGENIQLYKEGNSSDWRDTAPLVSDIWSVAGRLGVREFIPHVRERDYIEDDHLALHNVGRIPTCDIIDLSGYYDYWHTQKDTPEHCSALSLAKVGWVMLEWLKQVK